MIRWRSRIKNYMCVRRIKFVQPHEEAVQNKGLEWAHLYDSGTNCEHACLHLCVYSVLDVNLLNLMYLFFVPYGRWRFNKQLEKLSWTGFKVQSLLSHIRCWWWVAKQTFILTTMSQIMTLMISSSNHRELTEARTRPQRTGIKLVWGTSLKRHGCWWEISPPTACWAWSGHF